MRIQSVYRFFMNLLSSACDQDSEERQENESMEAIAEAGEVVLEGGRGKFIQQQQSIDQATHRTKNTRLGELIDLYMQAVKESTNEIEQKHAETSLVSELEKYTTMYHISVMNSRNSVTIPSGERIMIRPILPADKYHMIHCMVFQSHL